MTKKHPHSLLLSLLTCALLACAGTAHAAWQTPGQSTDQIAAGNGAAAAPGITTTVSEPFYKITAEDVSKAVVEQLQSQAVAAHAQATLTPGGPATLYTSDHALQVTIHALQIDPETKRWQGQAYILSNGKTEIVKPVSGTYDALLEVPVLTRQLRAHDVIAASDIGMRPMPQRQLRKDTITDAATLIGQSPRSAISAERPIRTAEVTAPVVIKKGDAVELSYQTQYMSIKTSGVALEDGAVGAGIRVKNAKSEKAVSGRVASAGHVEVNTSL